MKVVADVSNKLSPSGTLESLETSSAFVFSTLIFFAGGSWTLVSSSAAALGKGGVEVHRKLSMFEIISI